jgi:hypothetical protein
MLPIHLKLVRRRSILLYSILFYSSHIILYSLSSCYLSLSPSASLPVRNYIKGEVEFQLTQWAAVGAAILVIAPILKKEESFFLVLNLSVSS